MGKNPKRLVALSLSFLLVISIMPVTGLIVEAAVKPKLTKELYRIAVEGKDKIKLKNVPQKTKVTVSINESSKITLKPSNEFRWIDRVELPDFALTLYETLEEAIDGDGYNDYLIDDEYFDLDREDVFSNSNPGDFIRRSETRSDGSVFRHASILVTTTVSAEVDHDYISNCISAVHTAFKRDHPEAFWLQGKWQVRFHEDGVAYYCYTIISKNVETDEVIFDMRRPDFRPGYSGVADFTNGPALANDDYPCRPHLSYMEMPEKLVSGEPVAMTPILLCSADTAYIYSSTTLPAGLTLNPNTGEITGVVTDSTDTLIVTVMAANLSDLSDCAECTLKFHTAAD